MPLFSDTGAILAGPDATASAPAPQPQPQSSDLPNSIPQVPAPAPGQPVQPAPIHPGTAELADHAILGKASPSLQCLKTYKEGQLAGEHYFAPPHWRLPF